MKLTQAPDQRFDLRLHPTDRAYQATIVTPASLRLYESSIDGMLSVTMYDRAERGIHAATRLTRGQAIHMVNELMDYLGMPTYDDGLSAGHEQGWDAARDADLGGEDEGLRVVA